MHPHPTTLPALRAIIRHPAFRIGVLDAQSGRPFDTGTLLTRLAADPRRQQQASSPVTGNTQLAQIRYEEGRSAVVEHGLSCKSWTNPARPPASVRNFAIRLAAQLQAARARRQQPAAAPASRLPVWPTLPL